MRQIHGISMSVMCDKADVLKTLKKNKEEHIKILKEARGGFLKDTALKLKTALSEVKAVKKQYEKNESTKLQQVSISIRPPEGHVEEYDTVIKMLEMHQEKVIQLSADEVRQLIENKWGWMESFLVSNARYSNTAAMCVD